MKKALLFGCLLFLVLSCKKKEEPVPEPEPVEVQKGTLEVVVVTHDSLGKKRSDHSGVKVLLQGGQTATTGVSGVVSFPDLPHDFYAPVTLKDGFEGVPLSVGLNSGFRSVTLPLAQRSMFTIPALSGTVSSQAEILLDFSLSKPVPVGESCRIAVLTHTVSNLGPSSFESADTLVVTQKDVVNLNISQLPSFKSWVNKLPGNQLFFLMTVPVSYGLYESNLSSGPVLVGESLTSSDYIQLTKNW
jgi:hypothetical protein